MKAFQTIGYRLSSFIYTVIMMYIIYIGVNQSQQKMIKK